MYCSGCGEVLAGRAVCPRCGRVHAMPGGPLGGPAGYGMPAYAGMPVPLASVERRVNSLAVGGLVFTGLTALFGLMGLAFAHAFMAGHGGPWNHGFGPGFGHRYWEGPGMPLFFLYEPPAITPLFGHDEAGAAANRISMSEHTGTHVDAPFHFDREGLTVDQLPPVSQLQPHTLCRDDRQRCQRAGQRAIWVPHVLGVER